MQKVDLVVVPFIQGAVIFKDGVVVAKIAKAIWGKNDRIFFYQSVPLCDYVKNTYSYIPEVTAWAKENVEDWS